MKLRKRKRTFETTSKRVYELRSQIENAKMELAEELAEARYDRASAFYLGD